MSIRHWVGLGLGLSFLGIIPACGGGAGGAAKTVRPDAPKASDALGGGPGTCVANPWVVDMSGSDLGDITSAVKKGVVVVAQDCTAALKILPDCSAQGSYAYEGKPSLTETKQMNDADSIKAELSAGPVLAAKMSSDLQRGVVLDIAYTLVGKQGTAARVGKDDLKEIRPGGCKGATHIVESVLLGAFQMKGSTSAEVAADVTAFNQGVQGKSASSAVQTKVGGTATSCTAAKDSDTTPVAGCNFPLQLALAPLEEGSVQKTVMNGGAPPPPPPPRVFGMTRKTCTASAGVAGCTTACDTADGASCAILGFMYEKGKGGATVDPTKAAAAYKKGCDAKNLDACAGLGTLYSKGEGVPQDDAKAAQLLVDGCKQLNGRACSSLGNRARKDKDTAHAILFLNRACNLGYARACFYTASDLLETKGNMQDAFRAATRGCDGADLRGCLLMGSFLGLGVGVPVNASGGNAISSASLKGLDALCSRNNDNEACETLGDWFAGWYLNPKRDVKQAKDYYGKACSNNDQRACAEAKNPKPPPVPHR